MGGSDTNDDDIMNIKFSCSANTRNVFIGNLKQHPDSFHKVALNVWNYNGKILTEYIISIEFLERKKTRYSV